MIDKETTHLKINYYILQRVKPCIICTYKLVIILNISKSYGFFYNDYIKKQERNYSGTTKNSKCFSVKYRTHSNTKGFDILRNQSIVLFSISTNHLSDYLKEFYCI